jgi:hypothetical protein
MKEIQCPARFEPGRDDLSLFIAGGISNCPLWQKEFIGLLDDTDLVLLNPRRDEYDVTNISLEEEQIKWEFHHLGLASSYVFWFPKETLCPITLFELGAVSMGLREKRIFIGTHPEYARKRDIKWQMLLRRPEIDVVESLEKLAGQVKDWCATKPIIPS